VPGLQLRRCEKREERVTSTSAGLELISLAGYQLHDEQPRHATLLDQFGLLAPGARLAILTGEGATASVGDVVWKQQNVGTMMATSPFWSVPPDLR
jgi:hypothetical protein